MNCISTRRGYLLFKSCQQSSQSSISSLRLSRAKQPSNAARRPFSSTPISAVVNTANKPPSTASSPSRPPATKPTPIRQSTPPPAAPKQNFTLPSEPPPPTARTAALSQTNPQRSLTDGLADMPLMLDESSKQIDWTRSYYGLGNAAFSAEQQEVLMQAIALDDIEVKPDGIVYLPEIKYRRILNNAFGPGGWGLAPRGESIVTGKLVTREYGLVVQGRLVSIARGEQQYFDPDGIPTATEGCKSNALMRCCKDIGIASELWDPRFIRRFLTEYTKEVWVEHVVTKKKRKLTMRKDDVVKYPFKETKM